MSIYEQYETDTQSEEMGKWVELRGGAKVRIRSENSVKAREWFSKTAKKQRNLIATNGGVLPAKVMDENDISLCAEALISDWDPETVRDREGKPIAFSREMARRLMVELPALRRDILYIARTDETFRKAADDAAAEAMTGN